MTNLKFSGHESFHCRPFWLKKGYDHVLAKNAFNDQAGIQMGVGRNMVPAIRFWMKAMGMLNEDDQLSPLADALFAEKGFDPFLEDEGTLWLLHYQLCSKKYSTIYSLIFRELRKEKPDFSKVHLVNKVEEIDEKQSSNIVGKDFSVFTRTYHKDHGANKEDSYSGLFSELGLLREMEKDSNGNQLYHIQNKRANALPWQVLLYCILENEEYGDSVDIKSFYTEDFGVGNIFALSKDDLDSKLVEMQMEGKKFGIVYKNEAGERVLQFTKGKPDKMKLLEDYYG